MVNGGLGICVDVFSLLIMKIGLCRYGVSGYPTSSSQRLTKTFRTMKVDVILPLVCNLYIDS